MNQKQIDNLNEVRARHINRKSGGVRTDYGVPGMKWGERKEDEPRSGHIAPAGEYKNMMNEESLNECLKATGKSMVELYQHVASNKETQEAIKDELDKGTDWYTAFYIGAFPYIVSKD